MNKLDKKAPRQVPARNNHICELFVIEQPYSNVMLYGVARTYEVEKSLQLRNSG